MGVGSTSSFGTVITCSHLTIVRCRRPPSRGSKETCQTACREVVIPVIILALRSSCNPRRQLAGPRAPRAPCSNEAIPISRKCAFDSTYALGAGLAFMESYRGS